MKRIAAGLLLIASMVAHAQGLPDYANEMQVWSSTPKLYSACRVFGVDRAPTSKLSAREFSIGMSCSSFVSGVFMGISADAEMRKEVAKRLGKPVPDQLVCPPTAFALKDLVSKVVAGFDKDPSLMSLGPAQAVYMILSESFPCR
jgi:hypothetical protein